MNIYLMYWVLMAQIIGFESISCNSPKPIHSSQFIQDPIFKILMNKEIWGKDFNTALSYFEALQESGVKEVEINRNQLKFDPILLNDKLDNKWQTALVKNLDNASSTELYKKFGKMPSFKNAKSKYSEEKKIFSDSLLISLLFENVEFLNTNSNIRDIIKQIGAEAKIGHRVFNFQGDERPLVFILHEFEKGAIVFSESDQEAIPGTISKVIFNVPLIVKSLKSELK